LRHRHPAPIPPIGIAICRRSLPVKMRGQVIGAEESGGIAEIP